MSNMKSMRKNEKDYNVFIYRLVYLAGTCMQSDVVLFFVIHMDIN